MMADLAQIQDELAARIREFRVGGDPARILASETLELVTALAVAVDGQGGMSTSTMAVFGWFWWCRHQACEAAGIPDDVALNEARLNFYIVELLDVTLVPYELRHPVTSVPEGDAGAVLEQARQLIAAGSFSHASASAYAAIHAVPQGRVERPAVLGEAGFVLFGAFLCSDDPDYLDRAATVFTTAIDEVHPGDPLLADLCCGAATCAGAQYDLRRKPTDLKTAIGFWRRAAAQYSVGSEHRAAVDAELSAALLTEYSVSRADELAHDAVNYARRSLHPALSAQEHGERCRRLGQALVVSHTVTHTLADVDGAITAFRDAAGDLGTPLPDEIPHSLFMLYRIRFGWYGRRQDFDTALRWGEYCAQLASSSPLWCDEAAQALDLLHDLAQVRGPEIPEHCRDIRSDWLVSPLRERILAFVRRNHRSQLQAADAVPLALAAIKRYRADAGPTKAHQLYTIAWFFWCRYLVLPTAEGPDDFRLAGDYFARLALLDPQLVAEPVARLIAIGEVDLDPGHSRTLSHMAVELQRPDADTDAAVSLLRRLLPLVEDENRARCRAVLAWALAVRAHQKDRPEDLDEASLMLGDLASDAPTAAPDRALHLSRLAARLESRFHHDRTVADFDTTIAAYESALTDRQSPAERAYLLTGISSAYWKRYENFGRLPDLEAAVRWGREAVADPSISSPEDRGDALNSLAIALGRRFLRVGELTDIDEAIVTSRAAVKQMNYPMTRSASATRVLGALSNLRAHLVIRYKASRALEDLEEAIMIGQAVAGRAVISSEHLPEALTNLAVTLSYRCDLPGGEDFRDEAIAMGRQAVAAAPASHPIRPWTLSILATILHAHPTERHDLDDAISLFREAMTTAPPDHPVRVNMMDGLATALLDRFARDRSLVDLDLCIKVSRAVVSVSASDPHDRIHAAKTWAVGAAIADLWRTAAEGYEAAVSLLPLASWRGGSKLTRERRLASKGSLARDGGAAAIEVERPAQALQMLEAGRTVLWSQLLETRSDLTTLREVAPELAARCEALCAELDRYDRIDDIEGIAVQ